jgi:glucokinase
MLLKKTPSRILSELCKDDFSILEPKILTEAAHRGDRVSRETWQFVGDVLGAGLGTMVSILDIRKFVIGGGVAGAGNLIFKPAMSQLLRFTLQSMQADLEIVPAELGNSAGVMGASALCL